ncbi:MAG: hypothetical protein Q4G43_00845 [Mobilicoccus sp.]|nr:hypothetical protein [Mobilicoccus sp.]
MSTLDLVITLVALGVFLWCLRLLMTHGRALRLFFVTINLAILSGLVLAYQVLVGVVTALGLT